MTEARESTSRGEWREYVRIPDVFPPRCRKGHEDGQMPGCIDTGQQCACSPLDRAQTNTIERRMHRMVHTNYGTG